MKVEILRKGIKIDPAIPLQEGEILIKDEDTGNVFFTEPKIVIVCIYIMKRVRKYIMNN